MKRQPRRQLIVEIARALREAEYPEVATRMGAAFLWSMYPEWYDEFYAEVSRKRSGKAGTT
jgi:hypothetical protein